MKILPLMSMPDKASKTTTLSPVFPGVNSSLMGLPNPSTIAWILVFFPPRETPMSWLVSSPKAPFLRRRRVDGLLCLCCPRIYLAYQRQHSMLQISFLLPLRQTTGQTYHKEYSMSRIAQVSLSTAHHFALSIICH